MTTKRPSTLMLSFLWFFAAMMGNAKADVFSQAGPGTFDSTTPLISEVNFSDDEIIVDLEVEISGLEYVWAGDLVLTLTSPLGSSIDLVRRLGKSDFESTIDSGNSVDFRGSYVFSDDGAVIQDAISENVIPPGDYLSTTAGGQVESLVHTFGNQSTLGTWTLMIEDFDDDDSGIISGWSISTKSVADPDCDFNSDGVCDVLDLDGPLGLTQVGDLEQGVPVDSMNSRYDIFPDGQIDGLDLSLFLGAAGHRDGYAQGYLKGDTDLSGTIDFSDFLRLSGGFGSGALWIEGNFRGGGDTAFSDFLALSENFGKEPIREPTPAIAVPEPTSSVLWTGFLCAFLWRRTQRRSLRHMRDRI